MHLLPTTPTDVVWTLLCAVYCGYAWGHRVGEVGGWGAHCRAWGWTGWAIYFIACAIFIALFVVASLLSPLN